MPALVLFRRRLLIASDDVPLFALPMALFHTIWASVLIVVLYLYAQEDCAEEADYLPFLAGAAGAFSFSSIIEWTLFGLGLRGTPLQTSSRAAMGPLLYLHGLAFAAELAFAAVGTRLLHVESRLCPGAAWSPRPLAAALVGTSWAVIALNMSITSMALNPWHGLGVVESWEARLLWLARLLCCKVGLLTRAHVPDRDPALKRIAALTSHLLQHVDLTLSDVAAALLLVAAAQRERRRRALRDAMVAAAAALRPAAAAAGTGTGSGAASGGGGGGGAATAGIASRSSVSGMTTPARQALVTVGSLGSDISAPVSPRATLGRPGGGGGGGAVWAGGRIEAARRPAPATGPGATPPSPGLEGQEMLSGGRYTDWSVEPTPTCRPLAAAAWEPAGPYGGSSLPSVAAAEATPRSSGSGSGSGSAAVSPFLAVQGDEAAAGATQAAPPTGAGGAGAGTINCGGGGGAAVAGASTESAGAGVAAGNSGGGATSAAQARRKGVRFAEAAADGPPPSHMSAPPTSSSALAPVSPPEAEAGGSSGSGVPPAAAPGIPTKSAVELAAALHLQPSHAVSLLHPMVHLTPAGMEEHIEELAGELAAEVAAEVAAAAAEEPARSSSLAALDLDLDSALGETADVGGRGAGSKGGTGAGMGVVEGPALAASVAATAAAAAGAYAGGAAAASSAAPGSIAAAAIVAAEAAMTVPALQPLATSTAAAAATAVAAAVPGTGAGTASPPAAAAGAAAAAAALPPSMEAVLRQRISDAALAAAFAARRERVDVNTLEEALVFARYSEAIYGVAPSTAPASGRGGADASADNDAAAAPAGGWSNWWRRQSSQHHLGTTSTSTRSARAGSYTALPTSSSAGALHALDAAAPAAAAAASASGFGAGAGAGGNVSSVGGALGGILRAARRLTPHVVHVNTSNSAEGYLPYMVCLDAPTRSVVVAIRGTSSAEDIVTDCLCSPYDVRHLLPSGLLEREEQGAEGEGEGEGQGGSGGAAAAGRDVPVLVHGGIWAAAEVVLEDLQQLELLSTLFPRPPGQGAATAAAAAEAAAAAAAAPAAFGSGAVVASAVGGGASAAAGGGVAAASQLAMGPGSQPRRGSGGGSGGGVPPSGGASSRFIRTTATQPIAATRLMPPPRARVPAGGGGPRSAEPAAAAGSVDAAGGTAVAVAVAGTTGSAAARPPPAPAPASGPAAATPLLPMPSSSGAPTSEAGDGASAGASAAPHPKGSRLPAAHLPHNNSTSSDPSGSGSCRSHHHTHADAPRLFSAQRQAAPASVPHFLASGRGAAASLSGLTAGLDSLIHAGRRRSVAPQPPQLPLARLPSLSAAAAAAAAAARGWKPRRAPSLFVGRRGASATLPAATAAAAVSAAGLETRQQSAWDMWWQGAGGPAGREADVEEGGAGGGAAGRGWLLERGSLIRRAATAAPAYQRLSSGPAPPAAGPGFARAPSRGPRPAPQPSVAAAPAAVRLGSASSGAHGGGRSGMGTAAEPPPSALQRLSSLLWPLRSGGSVTAPSRHSGSRLRSSGGGAAAGGGADGGFGADSDEEELDDASKPLLSHDTGTQVAHAAKPPGRNVMVRGKGLSGGAVSPGGSRPGSDGGAGPGPGPGPGKPAAAAATSAATAPAPLSAAAAAAAGAGLGSCNWRPSEEMDLSGWRLVVTGHSLGGGAAALLALRLRAELPHVDVKCWAFSPPGSLASPALSEALQPFVVGVVAGKDLIPRLSLGSMERYRDEMVTALARCSCSKVLVLLGALSRRNRLRRAAGLLLPYDAMPDQARAALRAYHEAVRGAGRLPELHPPGRLLYLQPSAKKGDPGGGFEGSGGAAGAQRRHYRPVWVSAAELQSEGILASSRMLVDHSLTYTTLPALEQVVAEAEAEGAG